MTDRLNVLTVLNRMVSLAEEDDGFVDFLSDNLDVLLDEYHGMDGFGMDGSTDPRGDFKNGEWSMRDVEGVD